jgi:hypothetical protein
MRQLDQVIMADRCDGFQGHLSRSLDRPVVVLLEEDGADQAGDGGLVWKDADDIGAALDLAVEAIDRVCRVQLGSRRRVNRPGFAGGCLV